MAAELPYASDPTRKPAAAMATTRRVSSSRATVATLVFLTVSSAFSVRRLLQDGDRGGAAFVVFSYLNLALLVWALRRGEVAPQGSPARGRAKLTVWILTTTLTAAFMWKIGEAMPLGLAVAGWVVAAANQAGMFYVLVLRGEEKPSAAESLSIMRDCERDGGDLSVPAS